MKRSKFIQGDGAVGECGVNHGWILGWCDHCHNGCGFILFILKISNYVYILLGGKWIVLDECIDGRCCPMFVSAYPIKDCK